jgi:hypothetical protein
MGRIDGEPSSLIVLIFLGSLMKKSFIGFIFAIMLCVKSTAMPAIWAGYTEGLDPSGPSLSFVQKIPFTLTYGVVTIDAFEHIVDETPLLQENTILKCDAGKLDGPVLRLHLPPSLALNLKKHHRSWPLSEMVFRNFVFTNNLKLIFTHSTIDAFVDENIFYLRFQSEDLVQNALFILCGKRG